MLCGIHSLLRRDEQPDGEPRFAMLETIHAFARDQLAEAGEEDAARHAHLEVMLATAEEAVPYLRGPEQRTWFERLEREHDNLRAALDYALDRGHVDAAIRLAEALVRFWIGGGLTEGRDRIDRLLGAAGPAHNREARARLLLSHGVMTHSQASRPGRSRSPKRRSPFTSAPATCAASCSRCGWGTSNVPVRSLDEAFAITRHLGSRFLLPECLDVLARVRRDEGDARDAARLFGAAARERAAIGAVLPPRRRAPHAREIDSLREALGPEAFSDAWDEHDSAATL